MCKFSMIVMTRLHEVVFFYGKGRGGKVVFLGKDLHLRTEIKKKNSLK